MLYAPALYSLRTNSLVRTNDAINGMTSEQLRTGILQRCVSGRLTASYVALFDFTMQQPFRHFCSLSWETHDTQHSAPARWLHPLPPGQQPLITCVVAVISGSPEFQLRLPPIRGLYKIDHSHHDPVSEHRRRSIRPDGREADARLRTRPIADVRASCGLA